MIVNNTYPLIVWVRGNAYNPGPWQLWEVMVLELYTTTVWAWSKLLLCWYTLNDKNITRASSENVTNSPTEDFQLDFIKNSQKRSFETIKAVVLWHCTYPKFSFVYLQFFKLISLEMFELWLNRLVLSDKTKQRAIKTEVISTHSLNSCHIYISYKQVNSLFN